MFIILKKIGICRKKKKQKKRKGRDDLSSGLQRGASSIPMLKVDKMAPIITC